ncbi:hypothetical protein, partial [Candidatus Binatus sp.]|uniref:hypothetical protein n=1 Tax=Candidatus Binatus sp. TaxID=2811406 RepID=UPI003CBE5681
MRMIARIGFFLAAAMLITMRVELRAQVAASPSSAASPIPEAAAELKPGTIIGADNVDQYARYVPA